MRYFLLIFIFVSLAFTVEQFSSKQRLQMPYKKEGLSEREAAEHLLGRLSFGARPGAVEKVLAIGLEKWVQQQLEQAAPDTELEKNYRVMMPCRWTMKPLSIPTSMLVR